MKNLLKALQNARQYISEMEFKKVGKNTYSNYAYYTPEQIFEITLRAEFNSGLLSKFDLVEENNILLGKLTIFHLESGESLEFKMRSDIPEIKATNLTQKLGGAVTYTHRYLLTNAYKIAENQLDFDSNEQSENRQKQKAVSQKPELKIYKDKNKKTFTNDFVNCHNYIHVGVNGQTGTINSIKTRYTVSPEVENALNNSELLNFKK
jgi:hypothetical protein